MTIEHKKIETASWIFSLSDERLINQVFLSIENIKAKLRFADNIPSSNSFFSSCQQIREQSFDLEKLKEEQNIEPITKAELSQLAIDMDINESMDQLLTDLKSLG